VRLVEQWRAIEADLPPDWRTVTLDVVPETAADRSRAGALLGPANPGRVGNALRVRVARGGGAVGPEGLRNLFGRFDQARVWCSLTLVDSTAAPGAAQAAAQSSPAVAATGADAPTVPLASQWDTLAATLPPDWSDLHAELRFDSTDWLNHASLLCAPLNPTKAGGIAFNFRAARRTGYGASPSMVRRCLERCDAERMRGTVTPLRVLSETRNVATQGPVWRVGGRSV
jgi:hypothetical protein